jgi:hypothetical protein
MQLYIVNFIHSIKSLLRFWRQFCSNLGVFWGARPVCLRGLHIDYVVANVDSVSVTLS